MDEALKMEQFEAMLQNALHDTKLSFGDSYENHLLSFHFIDNSLHGHCTKDQQQKATSKSDILYARCIKLDEDVSSQVNNIVSLIATTMQAQPNASQWHCSRIRIVFSDVFAHVVFKATPVYP